MEVEKMPNGILSTNTYFAINEETLETVIVDPASASENMVSYIESEKLIPRAIFITHGHFDHIGGVEMLRGKYGVPVYVHQKDADSIIENPNYIMFKENYLKTPAENTVEDGNIIDCAGMRFKVLHTPGHSEGSVCYMCENVLFTGDTLFKEEIGRLDFPGGSAEDMKKSLKKIKKIDEDLVVHPGHGESSSLAHEKANNPYLNGEYAL